MQCYLRSKCAMHPKCWQRLASMVLDEFALGRASRFGSDMQRENNHALRYLS